MDIGRFSAPDAELKPIKRVLSGEVALYVTLALNHKTPVGACWMCG
jgi:hypothetical protein